MKKPKHCQPGSAILTVVVVMSAVVFICLNILKCSGLNTKLILKRQNREQIYRLTEGVLNYGVALCKQRFATLQQKALKGENPIALEVGTWKLEGHSPYKGKLIITPYKRSVKLEAMMCHQHKCIFQLSCDLECKRNKQKKPTFFVSRWKEDA